MTTEYDPSGVLSSLLSAENPTVKGDGEWLQHDRSNVIVLVTVGLCISPPPDIMSLLFIIITSVKFKNLMSLVLIVWHFSFLISQ